MAGASLHARRDELTGLVARGVDEPEWANQVVTWRTNCATSALGFLAAVCGDVGSARACHRLLAERSVNGMSMAWLMQIGYDLHAWIPAEQWTPRAGDLLHYGTPGRNDDHVEWCLSEPVALVADHGGGGRADNAITVEHGPIVSPLGRPLRAYLNLDALDIPVDTYEET